MADGKISSITAKIVPERETEEEETEKIRNYKLKQQVKI
jgi:hypothetical protein